MDSKRLAEIADVMEDRGLTRVRVEEPDGTAVELERASAAQPVAVPMPIPSAMAIAKITLSLSKVTTAISKGFINLI